MYKYLFNIFCFVFSHRCVYMYKYMYVFLDIRVHDWRYCMFYNTCTCEQALYFSQYVFFFVQTVLLSFASAENTAYVQVDTCTSYCNATMFQDCQCTNNSTILECDKTRWVGIYLSMTVNDTGSINASFPLSYTLM